ERGRRGRRAGHAVDLQRANPGADQGMGGR
ncbi:MAG: hypothetical protein AVDCRST_MAG77-5007, partial [uncultured Chloroflexi bacterium]